MNLNLVVFLERQILDNGDEDWSKGEHSWNASLRQVGDLGLLVEPDLLVLAEPVEDGAGFHVERYLRIFAITRVGLVYGVGLIKSEQFLRRGQLVTILKI